MCSKNKTQYGFTLIELLVVIAIVTVIAAILFPVFGTVRERGRRTVCQSNLKQIALAMQQYVQDNDGSYPSLNNWAFAANSYAKNTKIFRCPDQPSDEQTNVSLVDFLCASTPCSISTGCDLTHPVDYTYNLPRLVTFQPPFPTIHTHGSHDSILATPATIWLNVDASWSDSDGDHYFRTASTSCGRDFPGSTLHSGAGNYSYLDGHVKWLTPEEAGEIECANGPLPAPFKN